MQKQQLNAAALGRSRPTNNQLLYKAHFRWDHYGPDPENHLKLPLDTEACASVTAAFLKVLAILHTLEVNQQPSRNILMILANNTRRTKVLELSSGTHRIPDELKKHHLVDENGAQYSTNLDRNRYGNDNNYLFTVIKHDLETLGLCPCLVDVEIIDAKSQGDSQLVTAGLEVCSCAVAPPPAQQLAPDLCYMMDAHQAPAGRQRPGLLDVGNAWKRGSVRSCRSENEGSQKFEALLNAADAAAEEQNEVDNLLLLGNRDRRPPLRRGGPSAFDLGDAGALRKRPPKRVHTGLFSFDTSDFPGLSNLGQSGVALGDAPDPRGEVDQGPQRKARRGLVDMKKDPDVASEEGDTDVRFRDEEMAAEEAPVHKHGVIPRQNSAIVINSRMHDMRRLGFEMEQFRQMQASRALDDEAPTRQDEVIAKLQEDVQQIKEQVHSLLATNAESNRRTSALAMELAQSRQETSGLFKLLQDLLTRTQMAPSLNSGAAAAMNMQALELARRPGHNAGQGTELVAAPLAAVGAAAHPAHPAPSPLRGGASEKATLRGRPTAEHAYVPSPLRHNGANEPRGGGAGDVKQAAPAADLPAGPSAQLAPVAALDATSGLNNNNTAAATNNNNGERDRMDTSRLTSLAEVVSREDLEAMVDEQQWRSDDPDDTLKALPKLGGNFPSLSDLGSLFSVGEQAMDFLKEMRRPPHATQSVSSPSPGMLAALSQANASAFHQSASKDRLALGSQDAKRGFGDSRGDPISNQPDARANDIRSSPSFAKPTMPAKAAEATC